MLPTGVTITSIRQAPFITAANQAGTQTTYTFTVGSHGPFTLTLQGDKDTPANVQAGIMARVNSLREIGVIT